MLAIPRKIRNDEDDDNVGRKCASFVCTQCTLYTIRKDNI